MIEPNKNLKLVASKNPRSLLPNTLTVIGVCAGLSSIKFAIDNNFSMAIIALVFAAIIDTLDGRIARLIKGTSRVGKELDSLTDVISFGVAPSFIIYFWSTQTLGKIGWVVSLIYVVCCALRLARFNLTKVDESENWKINFFEGVPSPAAAGLVLLPLILNKSNFFISDNYPIICAIMISVVSILMVSNIPTYSLKRIVIKRNYNIFLLLGIGTYFGFLIVYTFKVLFITGIAYLAFIPISYFHYKFIEKKYKNFTTNESSQNESEDIL